MTDLGRIVTTRAQQQTGLANTATAGSVAITSTAPSSSSSIPFTTTTTTTTPSPPTTTTSTTTTTTTTTTSTSMARPQIALRSPIPIVGDAVSSPAEYDDFNYTYTSPWAIGFNGRSSTGCVLSTNGIVGIAPVYANAYTNAQMGATGQTGAAVNAAFPFWDDLLIAKGLPQGIFYQVEGTTGNRSVTFEWYTTNYNNTINYAHFLVTFYEALPSWVTYDYLNMTDLGVSATVGIASNLKTGTAAYRQYSYNQAIINNGLILTFNYTGQVWYKGLAPGFQGIPGTIYW